MSGNESAVGSTSESGVKSLDQSVTNTQANCVDGSVLFASLLRKIGINPFLVAVPGHMYLGFYIKNSENEDEHEYVGLETTLIGAPEIEERDSELPNALANLDEQLNNRVRNSKAWKSFVAAMLIATDDLEENEDKFGVGNPEYQTIDIAEAREKGIMPISFEAAAR